jgi:hypothetical protein
MGFVVDEVVLGQVFLECFGFSVSIPPMFHTHIPFISI